MFLRDFHCDACDSSFEEYVSSSTDREANCPACGKVAESVLSVPRIGAFSTMSPEAKAAHLRKRSHNHTMGELKKEPERFGFTGDSRRPWNLRTQKPSQK